MAQRFPPTAKAPSADAALLTSRDNKLLKKFRAALRGTGPESGEPIAIEGPKLVLEGVRSGLEVEALLLSESSEESLQEILHAAAETENGIPRTRIFRTTEKLFAGVAGTEMPQGVAALLQPREWTLDDVLRGRATKEGSYLGASPLIAVMAGIQDPGNVGTLVRSAEAFGATGAIATRGTADPWSPKAVRASAGSALRLPLLRGLNIPVVLAQLKVARVKIIATTARGERVENAWPDLREPCAILIGSEGTGLPGEILKAADAVLAIPMSEDVESLNAGVAAAVALYEAARQRRVTDGTVPNN
ncbi:MAG TPA: RNA methyltransferase [Candidatus Acidoferrum sp.]|nr:RNA methyltransferase [Candidatus Acidoferrum sp.]